MAILLFIAVMVVMLPCPSSTSPPHEPNRITPIYLSQIRHHHHHHPIPHQSQANVDEFVTRTVMDVKYHRPEGSKPENDALPAKLLVTRATEGALEEEDWPIPLDVHQMNPRLLLDYACERIMLHG